ncbi:MAG: MAPEG family protein [Myxococcales bacterium]|nr:MAG: MAPEG family protein [Myxococcales bacterium]
MEWIAIVTILALVEFIWFGIRVGAARGKYEIKAPATTGHDIFERHYRVQHNTLEQLVVFLPALWLFGSYVSGGIGALIGVVFLVGRALYAFAYVEDPAKRSTGFMLTFVPTALLLLGGLGGALMAVF